MPEVFRDVMEFQPTLPARGATAFSIQTLAVYPISTHAPREGSDGVQRRGQRH